MTLLIYKPKDREVLQLRIEVIIDESSDKLVEEDMTYEIKKIEYIKEQATIYIIEEE